VQFVVAGIADSAALSRGIVAEHVRTMLYSPARASSLPFILHSAANGDFFPLIETMLPEWRPPPPDGIAMGHYLSVTCSEDLPRIDSAEVAAATTGSFLGAYRVHQQMEACKMWPHARLTRDHFIPTLSAVPALLISGEADPVTPPRWAESALQWLPNGRHVVFPTGGHVPFNTPCATALAAEFFATANAKNLDLSCAAKLTRPSFKLRSGNHDRVPISSP
jgi:pimeloyl-ACP methyl ester carboxylesterase